MDMSRIVATNDMVFKYLFGAKSSTKLLTAFVNAVQSHAGMPEFSALEIVNPIGEKDFYTAKSTIIDVKAQAPDGTVVNVEVQVRHQSEYGERSLYYWAKSYGEQISEGEQYKKLMPVVSVSVLNFCLFPDVLSYHSTFMLFEKDHLDICLSEDCVMHYLELPKFPESDRSELADWLYALRHLDEKEGPMTVLLKRNETLRQLADRYHRFEKDSVARMEYEARLKAQRDQMAWMDAELEDATKAGHEKGMATGLEQGLEQGIAQGIAQGVALGIEKGSQQGKLEIIEKMLAAGLSLEQVCQFSGLSRAEITELRQTT